MATYTLPFSGPQGTFLFDIPDVTDEQIASLDLISRDLKTPEGKNRFLAELPKIIGDKEFQRFGRELNEFIESKKT